MTNHELAQVFANGATEGSNSNDTMHIIGNVMYSYGSHWQLARRDGGTVYVNRNYASRTTSKQTGLVARVCAMAGLSVVNVKPASNKIF